MNKLAVAVCIAAILSGCAGSVRRIDDPAGPATLKSEARLVVKDSAVRLSDSAKKDMADNVKFDPDALRSTIQRTLAPVGLSSADAAHTLDIEVTNIYVRGTFSAVMFGALAGRDNVTGTVRVMDAAGKPVRSFEVSASYAFGGFGGGQDGIRMNYLYEKFAELTRDQIAGAK